MRIPAATFARKRHFVAQRREKRIFDELLRQSQPAAFYYPFSHDISLFLSQIETTPKKIVQNFIKIKNKTRIFFRLIQNLEKILGTVLF